MTSSQWSQPLRMQFMTFTLKCYTARIDSSLSMSWNSFIFLSNEWRKAWHIVCRRKCQYWGRAVVCAGKRLNARAAATGIARSPRADRPVDRWVDTAQTAANDSVRYMLPARYAGAVPWYCEATESCFVTSDASIDFWQCWPCLACHTASAVTDLLCLSHRLHGQDKTGLSCPCRRCEIGN